MKEQGWETMIAARLRLLASADREEQAPPRVEGFLRSAYRVHCGSRRGRWAWVAWGAVAASVLAFLAITAPWSQGSRTPQAEPDATPPAAPSRLEPPAPPSPLPVQRRTPRPRRYNVGVEPRRVPGVRELVTEFIPLVDDDLLEGEETRQVVRVRVSRASLVSFGLPVTDDAPAGRIQADVILGVDGMARAIRFVRASEERE